MWDCSRQQINIGSALIKTRPLKMCKNFPITCWCVCHFCLNKNWFFLIFLSCICLINSHTLSPPSSSSPPKTLFQHVRSKLFLTAQSWNVRCLLSTHSHHNQFRSTECVLSSHWLGGFICPQRSIIRDNLQTNAHNEFISLVWAQLTRLGLYGLFEVLKWLNGD